MSKFGAIRLPPIQVLEIQFSVTLFLLQIGIGLRVGVGLVDLVLLLLILILTALKILIRRLILLLGSRLVIISFLIRLNF